MPLQKLKFKPGVDRENTNYTNEGGWYDCDKIRFRSGTPEKIGGWVLAFANQITGIVRALYNWVTLSGDDLLAMGTNTGLYLENGGLTEDITPVQEVISISSFNFTSGSNVITVNFFDPHGLTTGNTALFFNCPSLSSGSIPAAEINTLHEVTVIDADTVTIEVVSTAGSNGSASTSNPFTWMAGKLVEAGPAYATTGTGWGTGAWSRGAWGSPASSIASTQIRLWALDNYGEDLVANIRDGNIYYWQFAEYDWPAFTLQNYVQSLNVGNQLSLAQYVPTVAMGVVVTSQRHVVAFGCNPFNSSTQDRLLIRWSAQEDITTWLPSSTNTAGDIRMENGSYYMAHEETRTEILVWTDSAMYSMQYIGAPYVFSLNMMSPSVSISSPNAKATVGETTYWMGNDKFYMYNGRVQTLPCALRKYVFNDFNLTQKLQVCCGTNETFNEVWWFYPSANSMVNDRYVVYNYQENIWYYGNMVRTAWIDSKVRGYPVASDVEGNILYHEASVDDETTDTPVAIAAYIQSADMDIDDGYQFSFIKRIMPDVDFTGSTATNPTADFTVTVRNNPGTTYTKTTASPTVRTATVPVDQFTNMVWIRLRGRQMAFRISSDGLGTTWQLGSPRLDIQPDGRRA